jgi:6-phosphofructokinase 1
MIGRVHRHKRNARCPCHQGGDCQGLNAAIRGVGKCLYSYIDNLELFGIYDGYRGLVDSDYKYMEPSDFSGILNKGGTILGTSRQKYIPGRTIGDDDGNDLMPAISDTYNRLNLDCLAILGGNGTQISAKLFMDAGMNVVNAAQNH